jgi:hypothetical protein
MRGHRLLFTAGAAVLLVIVWLLLLTGLDAEAVAQEVRGAGSFGPLALALLSHS